MAQPGTPAPPARNPSPDSDRTQMSPLSLPVLVAALGYFVDIYDIVIFGVVRKPSLIALGIDTSQVNTIGQTIFNFQMVGMLLGGVLWGVLGDRVGRIQALWGCIILYSLANLACAGLGHFGTWMAIEDQYAWLRFIAGVGLAGELGAAITLVSELVDAKRRGWATALVAGIGVSGAVAAVGISKVFDWRTAYVVGGVLGLAILALRVRVLESGIFAHSVRTRAPRGNLVMLLTTWERAKRLLACILIGVPTWYVVGSLVFFSNKLAESKGLADPVDPAFAIMWCYIGLIAGDLGSGALSQLLRSRRRVIALFLAATTIMVAVACLVPLPANGYYVVAAIFGCTVGYWAVFVSVAAEQFGTNLRATVATIVPNVARGLVWPISLAITALTPSLGHAHASLAIGAGCMALAFLGVWLLSETWGTDLDWQET